jgi:hypothetical protein
MCFLIQMFREFHSEVEIMKLVRVTERWKKEKISIFSLQ